ncbi:MAG: 5'-methylthioadenosine/adenosylhomocysteine nucleosidase [Muribaculaceae bacterium]|nr:5'-methylthioadenosine/adenosylhomocysteine nucleosidase [Muribaculaceae bacterium]
MKIGILAAMDKEIALLRPLLENPEEVLIDGRTILKGEIGSHKIALMKCGIGKVNAALNTYRLIKSYEPDLIINSGVAGGADPSMHIADVLIAEYAAYHDVWCGPGTEIGAADGFTTFLPTDARVIEAAKSHLKRDDIRYGLIVSGDSFISKKEEVEIIKKNFPTALACDMESAAIAHVAAESKIPFSVIRVVSDTPGEGENISQYKNFWTVAPEKTFEAVRTIITNL